MNIPDAYSHPLFNPEIDRATQYTTRNILCTAIKDMSGKNIAVVQVRHLTDWLGAQQPEGGAGQAGAGWAGSTGRPYMAAALQCTPACMPWVWPATFFGWVAEDQPGVSAHASSRLVHPTMPWNLHDTCTV